MTSVAYPPQPGSESGAPNCRCLFSKTKKSSTSLRPAPNSGNSSAAWPHASRVDRPFCCNTSARGSSRSHCASAVCGCWTDAFARICCNFSLTQLMQPHGDATRAPSLEQLRVDGKRKAVNKANHEVSALYTLKHSSMFMTIRWTRWRASRTWRLVSGSARSPIPNAAQREP